MDGKESLPNGEKRSDFSPPEGKPVQPCKGKNFSYPGSRDTDAHNDGKKEEKRNAISIVGGRGGGGEQKRLFPSPRMGAADARRRGKRTRAMLVSGKSGKHSQPKNSRCPEGKGSENIKKEGKKGMLLTR